jgi:hypothetical protein
MKIKKPLNEATIKMLADSERVERQIQAVCELIRKENEAKGIARYAGFPKETLCMEANQDAWNC